MVSVGAVKMHIAHVVVGNISLDALRLLAGTLGIFIAIDIGKEVLHFGSALFGEIEYYVVGRSRLFLYFLFSGSTTTLSISF